jgi:cobalt-zinc-cadmium efflux system protein
MVTLHADIEPGTDPIRAVREIKQLLAVQFDITHATVEVEYGDCTDAQADPHAHPQRGASC